MNPRKMTSPTHSMAAPAPLPAKPRALDAVSHPTTPPKAPTLQPEANVQAGRLYLAGYNSPGTLERLDELVHSCGAIVLDIRFSPWGKPGVRKADLERRYGSSYRLCSPLGNENYRGGPVKLRDEAAGVELIKRLLSEGRAVVLLCCCADPRECHRTHIAGLISVAMPGLVVEEL